MREIKTRQHSRGVKPLEKAVNTGDRMKRAFFQAKEKAPRVSDDRAEAPNEYASDQLQAGFEEIGDDVRHLTAAGGKSAVRKGRKAIQNRKVKVKEATDPEQAATITPRQGNSQRIQQAGVNRKPKMRDNHPTHKFQDEETQSIHRPKTIDRHPKQRSTAQEPAERIAEEMASSERGRQFYKRQNKLTQDEKRRKGIRTRDKASSPTQRSSPTTADTSTNQPSDIIRLFPTEHRSRIKTSLRAEKSIKTTARSVGRKSPATAQRTIKAQREAIKTAKATPQVTVQSAKRTEQAARAAAKATQKAAKTAEQTAKTAAKAITTTVKSILAAMKALGAAIAAGGSVALITVVIICLIGLLVASCFGVFFSGEDAGSGMSMPTVVREINDEYEAKLEEIKSSIPYDTLEMSGSRAVWPDVLSIYSVKTTSDPTNGQEVATMDAGKKSLLKDVFWAMNEISYRTETDTTTTIVESEGEDGTIQTEEVETTTTTLYITVSHKTADEMADEYGFNSDQRSQLTELLSDENRSMWSSVLYGIGTGDGDIAVVALSQIGNVGGDPYWSWYGFSSRVDWCACFVSWCANECGYIENGVIPKFASCPIGSRWFSDHGLWQDNSYEPRAGDIIFFDWDSDGQDGSADHVGIVQKVENGYVYTIEGNSGDSCREKSYTIGYYEILGYGTPAY